MIALETRMVHIAGIVHEPGGAWVMQAGRNLLDCVHGFLLGKTHLILDRDPNFTAQFHRLLKDSGVQPVRLPASSPNLNAYAERFVSSIRRECLDKLVLLGEGHLRKVVTEYVSHYHSERNHQGLGNELIHPRPVAVTTPNDDGRVVCRSKLGGLLNYYEREAA